MYLDGNKLNFKAIAPYNIPITAPKVRIGKKIPPGNPDPYETIENTKRKTKSKNKLMISGSTWAILIMITFPPPSVLVKKYPTGTNKNKAIKP